MDKFFHFYHFFHSSVYFDVFFASNQVLKFITLFQLIQRAFPYREEKSRNVFSVFTNTTEQFSFGGERVKSCQHGSTIEAERYFTQLLI